MTFSLKVIPSEVFLFILMSALICLKISEERRWFGVLFYYLIASPFLRSIFTNKTAEHALKLAQWQNSSYFKVFFTKGGSGHDPGKEMLSPVWEGPCPLHLRRVNMPDGLGNIYFLSWDLFYLSHHNRNLHLACTKHSLFPGCQDSQNWLSYLCTVVRYPGLP